MKNHIFLVLTIIFITFNFSINSKAGNGKSDKSSASKSGQFFTHDLFVSGENNVVEYRIPSLISTKEGTVIALCDARVDRRGDAPNNIDLVMKKSHDGGKTWSESKVIADFPDKEAAADASMVEDKQTGTLWIVYDYAIPEPQGDHGRLLRIHVMKSEDGGNTWSSPEDLSYLTKDKNYWLQNGPGVGLFTDGIIIFPMYSAGKNGGETMLVYSKDHGKTWSLSNGVGDANVEPQVVTLSGGRIMSNMRRPRSDGKRQVAITGDLGKTWSEPYYDPALIDPGCMGSIINYNYNNRSLLVFSNAANSEKRENMTVRVSYDEGKTWAKEIPIYEGSSAYSCLTQLPNGNVGLLYEADNYNKLVFVEIPKEELF